MFAQRVSINDLKDDELMIIFSKLDIREVFIVMAVNKRWYSLIQLHFKLKKSLSFVNGIKDLSEWKSEEWFEVIQSQKNFQRVQFSRSSDFMSTIVSKCRNLRSLDLECFELDSKSVEILAISCPRIERLNLDSCDGITDQCIQYFDKHFHHLKYVNFSCVSQITESFMTRLLSSKHHLVALNVCGTDITGECLSLLPKTIKYLNISYCWQLKHSGVSALTSANCPNIKHLAINNFGFTSADESLVKICDNFKQLETLDMSFGVCTQKNFHLNSLTYIGFHEISRLERLESLSIKKVCALDDMSLIAIIQSCRRLRHLAIDMRTETTVTDISIEMISIYLPLLESLEISGNRGISDGAIISAINGLNRLTKLVLIETRITNKVTKFATKNCQQLRHLCLNRCPLISKCSLLSFIKTAELVPSEKFYFEAINSGISLKTIVKNNILRIKNCPKNIEFKISNYRGSNYLWFDSTTFDYFPKPEWL